jgi:predicted nucleic acid-binding protein
MKYLFVDTAGWVAAADAADPLNVPVRQARDAWLEAGGALVTTDYVCDETLTTLRMQLGLDAARRWWGQVDKSRRLRFESVDASRAERARHLFFRYADKQFSFTDCTSFVVMRELSIGVALTLDRHFRQMRFRVLPSE